MAEGLVTKIGRIAKETTVSRRNFLKIAGAASAVGAAGCADSPRQNVLQNLHGAPNQVPGIAVWYRSTCTECSAGCGIEVRTREGRAVKIEGSRENPINRGGLCAVGQASLQDLYDPDRVREPLIKSSEGGKTVWKPIAWSDAYEKIATVLADKKGKKALVTGEVSGALLELIGTWTSNNGVKHVMYEPLSPVGEARASELIYGSYGIPSYSFDKAEVILNFGADFLETWVSPCEYARDWSATRRSKMPARVFHVEPRLSLTGANADTWVKCAPGSELSVALAVLKLLVERGRGAGTDAFNGASSMTSNLSLEEVSEKSGVTRPQLLLMVDALSRSTASLVLSGGTASQSSNGPALHVVSALINVLLGNVGKTVDLSRMRKPASDARAMQALVQEMRKGEHTLLCIDRSNPAFTLPEGVGFGYGAKSVKLVVSFSNKLDETAQLADLILPASTSLESWGDARPMPGVYGLIQPAMTPVFDTKSLGDMLVDFINGMRQEDTIEKVKTFKDYLQASWRKVHASLGSGESFETFWDKAVERGGYFEALSGQSPAPRLDSRVFSMKFDEPARYQESGSESSLVVYPYASIKTFDGRSANRPWLQELPDPVTQVIWDAWAEMHPATARRFGLGHGDIATLRNGNGEINVPVYVTEFVHEGIVAVPLGQGHESFGRYAEQVGGANVYNLISPVLSEDARNFGLLTSTVSVTRSRIKTSLVHADGSKSQHGRELARTKHISSARELSNHGGEHGEHGSHEEHEEVKQMYDQRVHPLYRWGMAIDLAACTGCSACVVACYAENNIPVVGKELARQGREMSWLRIDRYYDNGDGEEFTVNFQPMLCQHCGNAPCEPVCPVYATYHNEEGLNVMVYNRCVGTRYCANNCSYKVRHFNWLEYETPEPLNWQFNPDVVVRSVGVMEKCTFCSQRIMEAKDKAKDLGREVRDGEISPACVQSCPTEALIFGDLNDPESRVSKMSKSARGYKVLDHHINTLPAITYLEDIKYKNV